MMDDLEFIAKMLESFKPDIDAGASDIRTTDGNTTQWLGENSAATLLSYSQFPIASFSPITISPFPQQTTPTNAVNNKTYPSESQLTNTLTTGASFVYILGAPTSPAMKLDEEPMTFLNQGQSYEMELICVNNLPEYSSLKSVIRVTFKDPKLQFKVNEQLEAWKKERHPTEKLIDLDLPLSYGITCATDTYNSLNSLEFFWDSGRQRATVGVRLNCVSSEFTPRKCGGERGAALRVQVDTYGLTHPQESKGRLLHCAYCLVKVFKTKGAERKMKNDTEWFNRLPLETQKSYRPSLLKSPLIEMSEDEVLKEILKSQRHISSTLFSSKSSSSSALSSSSLSSSQNYVQHPLISTSKLHTSNLHLEASSSEIQPQFSKNFYLCEDMTRQEVVTWLGINQFDAFIDTLNKYAASDLLRLRRKDFIDICGVAEGIRLSNAVHRRPVRPKLALYVSSHNIDCDSDMCYQEARMNRRGSIDSFTLSSVGSPSSASSTGSLLNRANGSLSPSPFGSCFDSTVDISAITATSSQRQRKRKIESVDDVFGHGSKRGCCHRDILTNNVYDLVHLDCLTRIHLIERLSKLCGLQSSSISEIYLQNNNKVFVDVTDLVVEHLEDESHYKMEVVNAVVDLQPITVLLLKSVANRPQNEDQL